MPAVKRILAIFEFQMHNFAYMFLSNLALWDALLAVKLVVVITICML